MKHSAAGKLTDRRSCSSSTNLHEHVVRNERVLVRLHEAGHHLCQRGYEPEIGRYSLQMSCCGQAGGQSRPPRNA